MTDPLDLQTLFDNAQADGLSAGAAGILVNNLNVATTAGAQGASINDLDGDQVMLFLEILDMTGSMSPYRHDVIQAYNDQLQALKASKAANSILMSTWMFEEKSHVHHGFLPLADVPNLTDQDYWPSGMTALYDATLDGFTSLVPYHQSLRDGGARTSAVVVVLTDGQDNVSRHSAASVATVAADLLNQELYTLALVSFSADGLDIARQMGFPESGVLTQTSDASSIRRALGTVSASVIRASQTQIGPASQSFFS